MSEELKSMLSDHQERFQACHAQSCMEEGGSSFLNKVILPIYNSLAEVHVSLSDALHMIPFCIKWFQSVCFLFLHRKHRRMEMVKIRIPNGGIMMTLMSTFGKLTLLPFKLDFSGALIQF